MSHVPQIYLIYRKAGLANLHPALKKVYYAQNEDVRKLTEELAQISGIDRELLLSYEDVRTKKTIKYKSHVKSLVP